MLKCQKLFDNLSQKGEPRVS